MQYNDAEMSNIMFLIHYGWRGTNDTAADAATAKLFLIHYGWRGTGLVSHTQTVFLKFLIHYGWRGTSAASVMTESEGSF